MHFAIKVRYDFFEILRFIKFNENDFYNKTKRFEMKFQYNFVISNDFVMRINLKTLLIIKRIINLNVNINKNIVMSSLSVLSDRFIINFKLNAFAIFNEVFLEIEIKLNKLLIFFSIIIYLF